MTCVCSSQNRFRKHNPVNIMKHTFTLFAVVLLASSLSAQQLSLFTQYREHNSVVNPAAVNSDYLIFEQNVSFGASYRAQWSGLEGAPRTQVLRGEFLADDMRGVSIMAGGHLINDQTGPTGFTGLYGRFGGIISDDPLYGGIAFGISGGIVQYRVDANDLRLREAGDIELMNDQTQLYPDVGLGVFAYTMVDNQDYVYGGVSVPQVIGLDLTFQDETGEFLTQRVQHFYAQAGYIKFFDDYTFLEPSVWVKYVPNAPINVDVNLRYQFAGAFWVGAGGSSAQTAHLEAGVLIGDTVGYGQNLKVGYGYDYSFSSFGPTVGGAHEINLSYSFAR